MPVLGPRNGFPADQLFVTTGAVQPAAFKSDEFGGVLAETQKDNGIHTDQTEPETHPSKMTDSSSEVGLPTDQAPADDQSGEFNGKNESGAADPQSQEKGIHRDQMPEGGGSVEQEMDLDFQSIEMVQSTEDLSEESVSEEPGRSEIDAVDHETITALLQVSADDQIETVRPDSQPLQTTLDTVAVKEVVHDQNTGELGVPGDAADQLTHRDIVSGQPRALTDDMEDMNEAVLTQSKEPTIGAAKATLPTVDQARAEKDLRGAGGVNAKSTEQLELKAGDTVAVDVADDMESLSQINTTLENHKSKDVLGGVKPGQSGGAVISSTEVSLSVPRPVTSPEWSERVFERIRWATTTGHQKAEIRLDPPDLGPLKVEIRIRNDHAQVTLTSHSAQVREILEQHLPRLSEMLFQEGFQFVDAQTRDNQQQTQQESPGHKAGQHLDTDDQVHEMTPGIVEMASKGRVDCYI